MRITKAVCCSNVGVNLEYEPLSSYEGSFQEFHGKRNILLGESQVLHLEQRIKETKDTHCTLLLAIPCKSASLVRSLLGSSTLGLKLDIIMRYFND